MILDFFKRKKPQVRVVLRQASTLTVAEWRGMPSLVTAAQKVFADPNFKAMVEVLRTDAPHNYGMIFKGAQPMEYAQRVGEIEGYLKCLNNLEAMALPLEVSEMPPATFEPPEKEN